MKLNEYQSKAKTFVLDSIKDNEIYFEYGLVSEVGELMGLIKKMIRDNTHPKDYQELYKKELGDVLWYLAMCAHNAGHTLEEIAEENIRKLESRKERGVLKGSGDIR